MPVPLALVMMFFFGVVVAVLSLVILGIRTCTMRITWAMLLLIFIISAMTLFIATPGGMPVDAPRMSVGEYHILSIAKRDKDDKAYLVVEDGKDVILVSVKRSSIEGKSPSMMKVEKEEVKKIPKKFVFD